MKIAPMCQNYRAYIKVTSVVEFQYLVQYLVTICFNHSYLSCTIKLFDGISAKNDIETFKEIGNITSKDSAKYVPYSRVTFQRVMLNVGLM